MSAFVANELSAFFMLNGGYFYWKFSSKIPLLIPRSGKTRYFLSNWLAKASPVLWASVERLWAGGGQRGYRCPPPAHSLSTRSWTALSSRMSTGKDASGGGKGSKAPHEPCFFPVVSRVISLRHKHYRRVKEFAMLIVPCQTPGPMKYRQHVVGVT